MRLFFLFFFLNRTWFLRPRAPSRHCTSMAGSGAREIRIAILSTRHDLHPETTSCFANSTPPPSSAGGPAAPGPPQWTTLIPPLTRLDGNLIVGTYIRRQWLQDFQKTLDRCDIRSKSAKLPRNHSVFLRRHFVAPIASRPPGAFRKRDPADFRRAITGKIARRITIRGAST